jgi:protein HIRA/HIR1
VNCTSVKNARNQLWEIFIGSPVVNFCLCAKYALFCSSDGNIRFVDIKSGVLVLPVLKLFTPAIQSVFVSLIIAFKQLSPV